MAANLFQYSNYRSFLSDWLDAQPKKGRGLRLQLSQAVGCHSAYITFVMNGRADFSLEQGVKVAAFLSLPEDEKHFFMLLLQHARAGSAELKSYFEANMAEVLRKRESIKNRIANHRTLSAEDQQIYYSSWHFAALHMGVSAPLLQTRETLARYFGLPVARVSQVMAFLLSVGLAREDKGRYKPGTATLHLGHDSPAISKHHANWRIQAIASLDRVDPIDLHYSSTTMISEAAAREIRNRMLETIDAVRKTVREAKEEQCYSYLLDLFKVSAPT